MDRSAVILVVSCLGVAQALFLSFYLFTLKKGNRRANFFLAMVILGLTLRIGKSILNEYIQLEAWQRNLGIAGILLVGPSLWYYGRALLNTVPKSTGQIIPHYLPYIVFSLFCAVIPNRFDVYSILIYYAVFAHLLVYVVKAALLGWRLKNRSQHGVFLWYRNLVVGVGIIWIFYMGNIAGIIPFYIGGAVCYTFLVYVFSFLLLQKHTFQLEKYQGKPLDENVAKNIKNALDRLFRDESIYLNHHVTLSEVARSLGAKPKMVSRIINESTGKNFSEYVNSYRVQKAKQLLASKETRHEKIASIAYDSGFNNVTSFNLAFKGMTKLTPSEFRRQAMVK